tara:strand:- start:188 stop:784 length:597 start_codon:yes stop_codon:yes gene_type:complete
MLRSISVSVAAALLLSIGVVETARAFSGPNPNAVRKMNIPQFRRINPSDRFKYKKRRLEQRDTFTTASGSTSFKHRQNYLRATQLRRIQEDLDSRDYTNIRRNSPTYYERASRSADTSIRRINRAERQGGIRLRRGTSTVRQLGNFNSEEKAEQIRNYRNTLKARETARYQLESSRTNDCAKLARKRQAQCWYNLRNN